MPQAHVIFRNDGCRIPAGGWPEERQHQIRAFRYPPASKGQPQIRVVLAQVHLGGHIKQASHTQGTVHRKPAPVLPHMIPAPLEDTVQPTAKIAQVLIESGNGVIHPLGGDLAIALGHRLEAVFVHQLVEGKDLAVKALPGIFILILTRRRIKSRGSFAPVLVFRLPQQRQAQQYCQYQIAHMHPGLRAKRKPAIIAMEPPPVMAQVGQLTQLSPFLHGFTGMRIR